MLYSTAEQQPPPPSATSTLVLLTAQQHRNYEQWYYTATAINPRSARPTVITGIRGPANALSEPTLTRRLAYIQRTGRSFWEITQLEPFTKDEYDSNTATYTNIWY